MGGRGVKTKSLLTLSVFVQVCDILPLVTAHALGGDALAYKGGADDLFGGAVGLLHEGLHVGVHLGKHKRSVVFHVQLTLFYGLERDWATAIHI